MAEMNPEQRTILKNFIIELSCLINRETEKFCTEYPGLTLPWRITLDASEGEKTWLGNMVSRDWKRE